MQGPVVLNERAMAGTIPHPHPGGHNRRRGLLRSRWSSGGPGDTLCRMSYVFFSYSRRDMDRARKVIGFLQSQGFVVWQDVSDIRGGDNWMSTIQTAVSGAAAVVVLW